MLTNQRNARKTSQKERMWLDYLNDKKGRNIKTEWNQPNGQKRIGPYYPDGIEEDDDGTITVFEFFGCQVKNI